MVRVSLAAAVAAASLVVPAVALHGNEPVIPANFVGTWRLDSLLDQAEIDGPDPSDVDPAFFVLRDLRFKDGDGGAKALDLKAYGKGEVSAADGHLTLKATGKVGVFTVPVPKTKATEWGLLAVDARTSDAKEVAIFAESQFLQQLQQFAGGGNFGGPNLGGMNFGPGGGVRGGPFAIPGLAPANPPAGGPPGQPGFHPPAGGPPGGASPTGAPAPAPAGGAPGQAPAGGAPAPAPAGGAQAGTGVKVVVGPGAPPGLVSGNPPGGINLDPRQILGGSVVQLESDGAYHTIARTHEQASSVNAMFGRFMGGQQQEGDLTQLTIVLLVPPEKEKEGVSLDIDFVHVLDPKVEYAGAIAKQTTVTRDRVLQKGLAINTTSSLTWRLVAPEGGRLLAGLTDLTGTPCDVSVAVTCEGNRDQLTSVTVEDAAKVLPLDVDLAKYAGKEIALTLEFADQGDPAVAFMLQPIVYGRRKDGVKNVLLFFCDTLRADGLGCYGNTRGTSPNLDAIAADGVRFERSFSQGPWTYVSMPSSLSSLFPSVSGVRTGGEQIPDSCTTVAEAFRDAGYLTCAMIRNDFVGPTTHTEQGFDFFFPSSAVGTPTENPAQNANLAALLRRVGQNPDAIGGAGGGFDTGSTKALYTTSQPWLDKYKDIPFFLYLHSVEPHGPYNPPKEELANFGGEEARSKFLANDANSMAMTPKGNGNVVLGPGGGPPTPPPADAKKPTPIANAAAYPVGSVAREFADLGIDPKEHAALGRDLYDASVHYMDEYVGKVVGRMKELGFWDHMVFSFNADHGEEFFDHNNSGHGQSVFAELNHVPWILHAPGILPAGKLVKDNSMNLDLGPTLLGLIGLPVPDSMQGRNLAADLEGNEKFPSTMIVTELWGGGLGGAAPGENFSGGNMDDDVLGRFSVIEGRWKTIITRYHKAPVNADGTPVAPNGPPGRVIVSGAGVAPGAPPQPPGELVTDLEVYDLDADMTDSHPVTAQRQEEAQKTLKRFLAWVDQMKETRKRYAKDKSASDDATAALRRLGYAR